MQIINILLIITGVLTFLSGIVVFAGSGHGKKGSAFPYLLAVLGAAVWSVSMAAFMNTAPGDLDRAHACLLMMYISVLVDTSMLFLYVGWSRRSTWFLSGLIVMLVVWLGVSLVQDPSRLFAEVILDPVNGNSVVFANGLYLIAYMSICSLSVVAFLISGLITTKGIHAKNERRGMQILLIGLTLAGSLGGFFDIFLPLQRVYSLIWVGPLATSVAVLLYYYAILKYRLVSLSSSWLKIFSYVILMAVAATIYIIIFSLVFSAIFRSATPSLEIIAVNLIVVVAILLLSPAINEITVFARSLLATQVIDIDYISKKLIHMVGHEVDPRDLSSFLASYGHFQYVGFLIGGKLYSSGALDIAPAELHEIEKLGKAEHGVWQKLSAPARSICDKFEFEAVAEIKNEDGATLGQLILGRPQSKKSISKSDYTTLNIIVGLVSSVLSTGKIVKKK